MNVRDLIKLLQKQDQDAEVLLMEQQSWPFEYAILGRGSNRALRRKSSLVDRSGGTMSTIRYTLVQVQKDGSVWRSIVLEKPTLHHVKCEVLAGFLFGEPRHAEDEQGRVLCGLDAKGKWTP